MGVHYHQRMVESMSTLSRERCERLRERRLEIVAIHEHLILVRGSAPGRNVPTKQEQELRRSNSQ